MTSISRSTLLSLATLALMAAGSFGCGGAMGDLKHVSRSVDDTVDVVRGRADAGITVTANALQLQVDGTPQCEAAEVQQVEIDRAFEREGGWLRIGLLYSWMPILSGGVWFAKQYWDGPAERGHWLGVEAHRR